MNKVIYVRAGLKGITLEKKRIIDEIKVAFSAEEVLVPSFTGARIFYRSNTSRKVANSAISNLLKKIEGSVISTHPSHQFIGTSGLNEILSAHDFRKSCFWPIKRLAETSDGGMLVLGCLNESPGFSTVHAVQEEYGLTKKHLVRFLYRWDINSTGKSIIARELPGCSLSFGKFYKYYEDAGIVERGVFYGLQFMYIRSMREAMNVERNILADNPRFVRCNKKFCITCSVRYY